MENMIIVAIAMFMAGWQTHSVVMQLRDMKKEKSLTPSDEDKTNVK